jgi:acyl transferase domain-containing protein/thioesterase domain-containing protein/aryl carrier-like protein
MTQLDPNLSVAIIGLACRLPGARTADEYWENLAAGHESIQTLTDEELREAGVSESVFQDASYVRVHAPIPDLKAFDARFFGFSPREAAILDPQHRHFMEVAWEAFENAGHVPGRFPGSVGVFAGSGHHHYLSAHVMGRADLLRDVGFFLLRHTGNDKDFLATRISYLLNLQGPSIAVQTACSTSLVAVHLAMQSLLNGECDLALAGGVTIELPEGRGYQYAEGEILSPDGRCRPFDAQSQGTVFGSGCGAVVLRRFSDAVEDGDFIHAVIRGSAVNNDGSRKVGYLAPSVEGQAQAAAEALALAGVEPSTVSYIEAHGTGTPVGDPIEVVALAQAYGRDSAGVGSVSIGSVKSNIGHLDTAAGVASLIKVVESLKHRELVPTLHFTEPNPTCDFESTPFRVQSRREDWVSEGPRRAAVSSLGVGGTNAHIILEEAPASPPAEQGDGPHLLLLSAKTPVALERMAARLADRLERDPLIPLADTSWTLQKGREEMRHRCSMVASDVAGAVSALRDPGAYKQAVRQAAPEPPPVTFLFAGGGAQFPGMGADLYEKEPVFRSVVDRGLSIVLSRHGLDLRPLLFPVTGAEEGAAETLQRPTRSLPSLFIIQSACAALWRSWGVIPSSLLGHSMGEYTAACEAGIVSFEDALALVFRRGELFERIPEGGMVSVALSAARVREFLPPGLAVAAENAPELCVVSGPDDLLGEFESILLDRDIDSSRIHIRVAAHSPMLDPILDEWRSFVQSIPLSEPTIPLVSNLTGEVLTAAQAVDPEYWVRQLRETVRFADGVSTVLGKDPAVLLECGPGRILTTLARQHPSRESRHELAVTLRPRGDAGSDRAVALESLGRLWSAGLSPDLSMLHADRRPRRVPLPTYPFERDEHWLPRSEGTAAIEQSVGPLGRLADMSHWSFQPGWRRGPEAVPGGIAAQVLLLGGDRELRSCLLAGLSAAGAEVTLVDSGHAFRERSTGHYVVDPERPEHFRDLFRALARAQRLPGLVVHAWNAGPAHALPNADRAGLASVDALGSILWLAQAIMLEQGPESVRLAVLTTGAQAVGEEPVEAPLRAMAAAACAVISTEGDGVSGHAIDLQWPQRPGPIRQRTEAALINELRAEVPAPNVALRGGERWVPDLIPSPLAPAHALPTVLREGGAYLVTGGLGGIGLEIAELLARRWRARLALVSRTALPPEAEWDRLLAAPGTGTRVRTQLAAIRRLRERGTQVLVLHGDVGDRRTCRRIVGEARKAYGILNGVFHAAGVLGDALLGQKTPSSVERVLRPKVQGTLALDEFTADDSLDFFVLFSSTSAFMGLAGQADYAAANAFLDAFARWRSERREGRTVAINWSIWQEVGMAARLADAQGVSVPPATVPRGSIRHHILERVVSDRPDEFEVSGGLRPRDHWVLSEHRFRDGDCVLPGTGYLDLVGAAVMEREGTRPLILRDVGFTTPCAVAEEDEREIRVRLTFDGSGGGTFVVRSRPVGRASDWTEHCYGAIQHGEGEPPLDISLREIRARIGTGEPVVRGGHASVHIAFGPRWQNVRRKAMGLGEALLELDLGGAFSDDISKAVLHPALLDMATAGAQDLLAGFDADEHFFVPLSYGSIRAHARLEEQIVSHVRLRPGSDAESDTAVYDVCIMSSNGRVLVEIEEFTMIRVRQTGSFRASRAEAGQDASASPLAEALRVGILPAEGMDILLRVLESTRTSRVVVAPAGAAQFLPASLSRLPGRRSADHAPEASALEQVPPRTPLQAEMVRIASELLGVDRLGITEPLVDLGLHSLLAVRLFNRLQRQTGRNVPLSALLEAPSIESLSLRFGDEPARPAEDAATPVGWAEAVVQEDFPLPARGVYDGIEIPDSEAYILPPEEDPSVFSSLVPLKPSGSRTPFFVIHARGGAVLNYQRITSFVDADQPVYGLQSQGLDGVTEPLRSIEAMARLYTALIRKVQPKGPYLLGGGSLGGIVALEMAHELALQGEDVALLAMFDSWGPNVFMDVTRLDAVQHVGSKYRRIVLLLRERGAARTFREVAWKVHGLAGEGMQSLAVRWHRLLQRTTGRPLPHAIRYQFVERVNLAALRVYRPRPWPGDVVLFRAVDDPDFDASDPTMGWSDTVQGHIHLLDCPGTHNTIMKGPVFGQYLTQELRTAQRTPRVADTRHLEFHAV